MIHVVSNLSAVKAGASNVNSIESWKNGDRLAYTSYDNRFMGPQLDATHESDQSQIKEVTQVISALSQNGNTAHLAKEAYEDIAQVIKKSTEKYLKYMIPKLNDNKQMAIDSEQLYKYLSDKFISTIESSKGDNIAKVLVQAFSSDIRIPFSNQNFFVPFVRDIITRMNNEFITRYYAGTGAVLIPSHGIVQLYDIPQSDGRYRTMTQQDMAKEALENFDTNKSFDVAFTTEEYIKPWKNDPTQSNTALSVALKHKPSEIFELVTASDLGCTTSVTSMVSPNSTLSQVIPDGTNLDSI